MIKSPSHLGNQAGVVLLESLIAILIFSLGILSIVGMQAIAVKQVTDAKYRSDACLLANQLLGTMWVSNRTPALMSANFSSPSGAGYTAWLGNVSSALPGVAANPPTVTVDAVTGGVTIAVFWLAPSEAAGTAAHRYVATAQIKN